MKTVGVKVNLFRLIGFWQLVVENHLQLPWIAFLMAVLVYDFFYMQTIQLLQTFLFEKDLVRFIDKTVCSITCMEGAVKFIYHWINRKQIKQLLQAYRTNYLMCMQHQKEQSIKILKRAEKIANAGIIILYFLILSTSFVWSLTTLGHCLMIDCKYLKILPTWFPFDQTIQPAKSITYFLDFIIVFFNGFTLSVVDAFIFALFIVISSQIEVLGNAIQNIKTNAESQLYGKSSNDTAVGKNETKLISIRELSDEILQNRMDDLLKACLKDHQKILRLIQLLEQVYNPLLLFQLVASCLTICMVGVILILPFAIPATNQSVINIILSVGLKYFAYLLDAIFELFVFSWCGFIIGEQTKRLHRSFYNSDWPDGSRKFRKNVLLAITRANRPSNITAGKFQSVNLNSFGTIMKASYSYLMVLYGFVKKLGAIDPQMGHR